jgi:hypothetical protein
LGLTQPGIISAVRAGVALHRSRKKYFLAETLLVEDAYPDSQHSAGFHFSARFK